MQPLSLWRRLARGVVARVRRPWTHRRSLVTAAVVALVAASAAGTAHAAARGTTHQVAPTWLFSKILRSIGQLFVVLADWLVSIGH